MSGFTTLQDAVVAAGGTLKTATSGMVFGALVAKTLKLANVSNVYVAVSPAGLAQYAKMNESIDGFDKSVKLVDATSSDTTRYMNDKTTAKYAQSVRSHVAGKLATLGYTVAIDRLKSEDVICGFGFRLVK